MKIFDRKKIFYLKYVFILSVQTWIMHKKFRAFYGEFYKKCHLSNNSSFFCRACHFAKFWVFNLLCGVTQINQVEMVMIFHGLFECFWAFCGLKIIRSLEKLNDLKKELSKKAVQKSSIKSSNYQSSNF